MKVRIQGAYRASRLAEIEPIQGLTGPGFRLRQLRSGQYLFNTAQVNAVSKCDQLSVISDPAATLDQCSCLRETKFDRWSSFTRIAERERWGSNGRLQCHMSGAPQQPHLPDGCWFRARASKSPSHLGAAVMLLRCHYRADRSQL